MVDQAEKLPPCRPLGVGVDVVRRACRRSLKREGFLRRSARADAYPLVVLSSAPEVRVDTGTGVGKLDCRPSLLAGAEPDKVPDSDAKARLRFRR